MTGITAAWQSILSVVLKDVVFDSDAVAGNIGLWGGFAGQAAGVALSLLSDWVGGKKRGILIVLAAVSTVLIVIFAWLCLPDGHAGSASGGGSEASLEESASGGGDASWALYAVSITLNLCQGACFPIFYEMGVHSGAQLNRQPNSFQQTETQHATLPISGHRGRRGRRKRCVWRPS